MKKRKLNLTIEFEDDDYVQFKIENLIYNHIGKENVTHLRVLPNTDHLKDDEKYKELYQIQKDAKDTYYKYVGVKKNK